MLHSLSLHDNSLQEIPSQTFRSLRRLSFLTLSRNQLTHLNGELFTRNSRLFYVVLDFNRINAIQRNFLDENEQIGRIDIAWNECASAFLIGRQRINDGLARCFENFEEKFVIEAC
jgi:Leucine-rich repeat (LRR) protein